MEQSRREEPGPEFKPVERGWCPGSESFRAERQAAGEVQAERLVRSGFQALGWTEKELSQRRKGDIGKVNLARQLRRETTMTLD